ncbi:DUF6507 family protein [Cellulomonas dongxiuzhuiae]|uniref:DUF6507 family protein n=1 Tax=Cellulomonas dongxiuzhuiae TaxID=2819979 RepID=UPI001AAF53B1|nr:DUF6507 family protein [Cellulomonas dongxiuzhuiae]MBO3089849.1 hypothetical protein [Cellulomonas dongxiuzhuiae]
MSSWSIQPADVQSVLNDVQTTAAELGEQLTEAKFQAVLDGLTWAAPLTGDVPAAVNAMLGDQMRHLTNISNRIQAGTVGVANAVIAYNNGQEDMAGSYQTQLLRSAESGDFTYFVQHGHKG